MKTAITFTLLAILLAMGTQAHAQLSKEAQIKQIKSWYYKTQNALEGLTVQEYELELFGSSEGEIVKTFHDGEQLVKVIYSNYGEGGENHRSFFLHKGMLYFAFDETKHFNAPVYVDSAYAAEYELGDWYQPELTKVTVERYYLYDGRMISWLDTEKKEVAPSNSQYAGVEKELLSDIKAILQAIE